MPERKSKINFYLKGCVLQFIFLKLVPGVEDRQVEEVADSLGRREDVQPGVDSIN
jgi:hypothetical protein